MRYRPEIVTLAPPFRDPVILASVGYLPVFADGVLVVSHTSGEVVGYDPERLDPLWRFALKSAYERSMPYRGALIRHGPRLFVNDDGELAVLEAATGRSLGRYLIPELDLRHGVAVRAGLITLSQGEGRMTLGLYPESDYERAVWNLSPVAATPLVCSSDSICVYARNRRELAAVTVETGKPLWNFSVAELGAWEDASGEAVRGSIAGTPIMTERRLIAGVTGHRIIALDLDTGALAWQCEVDVLTPSNLTYGGQGTLHALGHPTYYRIDVATGKMAAVDVRNELERIGVTLLNQLDLSTTHLYASGMSGPLFAMDRTTNAVTWTWPVKGRLDAALYPLVTERHLWFLDPDSNLLRFSPAR